MKEFSKENIKDIYFLSPLQQGILFHALLEQNTTAYFQQIAISLRGMVELNLLERSFTLLMERYDILRTNFVYKKTQKSVQVVFKERETFITYEDISHLDEKGKELYRREWLKQDQEKGFDLTSDLLIRVALLKLNEESYQVIWSYHHILMDGWSLGTALFDFFRIYESLKNGKPLALAPPVHYSDFIKWLAKQDQEDAASYWKTFVANYEQQALLPLYSQEKAVDGYILDEISLKIDETLLKTIETVAVNHQVTLNVLFQTIWGVLLQRYNNVDDIVFGAIVSGRKSDIPEIENMVGLLINSIPVRVSCEGGMSFSGLLKQMQQKALQSEKYDYFPLYEIQSFSDVKQGLVNHILIFENYPLAKKIGDLSVKFDAGFAIEAIDVFEQTNYDFNITFMPGNGLTVKFSYNMLRYSRELVNSIQGHMERVIRQVINDPEMALKDIDILTETEKRYLINGLNDTAVDYPVNKTIHQLFEAQVDKTPNLPAVIFEEQQLSYRELNRKANCLADMLRGKGIKPDMIVGLMVERSLDMIIGLLGVLKSGGAYLPIDPEYPPDRINYMLSDSKAPILLSHRELIDNISFQGEVIDIANLETSPENVENLEHMNTSGDLAYVIYTSGSTGRPKGVMINHRAIHNFIKGITERIAFSSGKTILSLTTISFDIFVLETLLPLTQGLKVVVANETQQKDPGALSELVMTQQVEMIQFTPSRAQMLLNSARGVECLKNIKEIMIGGEALPDIIIEKLTALTNAKIYNMYGPTETTVWSLVKDLTGSMKINIGKPIANTQVYLLGKHGALQPLGAVGELCIGGDGLAREYLYNPSLTAEKFIPNPFSVDSLENSVQFKEFRVKSEEFRVKNQKNSDNLSLSTLNSQLSTDEDLQLSTLNSQLLTDVDCQLSNNKQLSTERMYRTGDLARWLASGEIEFLGRVDQQLKIRGFRIEPGEIESVILNHELVSEAVVVAKQDQNGIKYLCAYIISEGELEAAELKEYLAGKLPDYMIPSFIVRLDYLPLTPNGKIDRKNLPEPKDSILSNAQFIQPRNEMEEQVAAIWQTILHLEKVSINAPFFEIGGNSISLVTMHNQIEKLYPGKVKVKDLFTYTTVAKLVEFIISGGSARKVQQLSYLTFPPEYFENQSGGQESTIFEFQFPADLGAALQKIAADENVDLFDITLAVYIHLLALITKEQEIPVQTTAVRQPGLCNISINMQQFDDYSVLIKTVNQKRLAQNQSELFLLSDLTSMNRASHHVATFFCAKRPGGDTRLTAQFDIVMEVAAEDGTVNCLCEYNSERLNKDKVKQFINEYLKLSAFMVNKYFVK